MSRSLCDSYSEESGDQVWTNGTTRGLSLEIASRPGIIPHNWTNFHLWLIFSGIFGDLLKQIMPILSNIFQAEPNIAVTAICCFPKIYISKIFVALLWLQHDRAYTEAYICQELTSIYFVRH